MTLSSNLSLVLRAQTWITADTQIHLHIPQRKNIGLIGVKGRRVFFFRITFKSKFWKINTLQYYWLTFISSSIQTNAHTFLSIANVANNFPSGENAKDMGNVLHWKNFKKRIFIKWFLTPNSSPWNAKRAMHSPTCTYRVHWACYKFSSLANLPVCTDAPHP